MYNIYIGSIHFLMKQQFRRPYVYLLYLTLLFVVSCSKSRHRVQGSAMEPILKHGQQIVIDKSYYKTRSPSRFDIVAVREPNGNENVLLRVVALPGEIVSWENSELYINGKKLSPSVIHYRPTEPSQQSAVRVQYPLKLQSDSFYILGDNPSNSFDSRFWGGISSSSIVGKLDSN